MLPPTISLRFAQKKTATPSGWPSLSDVRRKLLPEEFLQTVASALGGIFDALGCAAGAALLLVWGAWSTLEGATQDQRIAPPPDLKSVVESVEAKGEQIAERALHEGRAEAQVPQ